VAEVHFDQAEQIELSRWSEGRVALVGDAAGCVSLLAGQGASLAVAGAAVLAAELAAKTTSPRRSPATRPGSSRSCSARRRAGANSPAGSSPTAASGSGCAT
jgi:2-polyprenyl-6-methoxyphenol hydroxylase-like FAD-dependent oxidoreductase